MSITSHADVSIRFPTSSSFLLPLPIRFGRFSRLEDTAACHAQ